MLSRFVITFLQRGNHLLISQLQSPLTVILENKKRKSVTTSTFSPSIWRLSTTELMLLIVVLEKTLESLLDCKEIKPVNLGENQPWILIGRTDAEAPILWPPDVKSWLTGKDPAAGKNWGQEEKGKMEDKMVGWHHWLNRHKFQ